MIADTASRTPIPESLRAIEGSRGTVVFGNGIPALTGDVVNVAPDHLTLETSGRDGYTVCVVPFHAIAYYRFANDDD